MTWLILLMFLVNFLLNHFNVLFQEKPQLLPLRWYGTLDYGDFHEKFNFFTIQDLRPLNTCQKHFEMILPNFPLDECESEI